MWTVNWSCVQVGDGGCAVCVCVCVWGVWCVVCFNLAALFLLYSTSQTAPALSRPALQTAPAISRPALQTPSDSHYICPFPNPVSHAPYLPRSCCSGLLHPKFEGSMALSKPVPVAVLSKSWVCCSSLAGISGSNPSEGMDVRLLC